jgi:putative peptidoglycan lipid II flippase
MAFLLIPASVTVAVLATPIVRLLYQRGAFTPEQTTVVAGALAAFSLGLTFNGAMLMLNRAFFSLQENWIPTAVAVGNLVLNALLDWALYRVGVWGIPLSTSLGNIACTVVLVWLLRRRLGGMRLAPILSAVARILVAAAIMGVATYFAWRGIDSIVGGRFVVQAIALAGGIVVGSVVYVVSCRLLRVRELNSLLSLRGRVRRA